jgi:hypothetical protein
MSQASTVSKFALLGACAALVLCAGSNVSAKTPKAAKDAAETAETAYTPPLPNEVVVSDRDFNQFVFPSPIVNGPIFPAGSPLLGKPVYLAGNTQVLLQVAKNATEPFNMIVELENGAVYKFYLRPRPINGITHRVDGANEKGKSRQTAAAEQTQSSSPRGADVELLKRAVLGQVPQNFDAIDLPPLTRFNEFSVVPLAGWSDGVSRRIMSFSLVAVPGHTAAVAPPQFYRAGITAVLVDGDVVDATHSPTLYVVEEFHPDEQ